MKKLFLYLASMPKQKGKRKIILFLSQTPTIANVYPLGGTLSNPALNVNPNGDPTFNPIMWELDRTMLNAAASPTTGTDLLVYFTINGVPEQNAIAQAGGYNYTIVRNGVTAKLTYTVTLGVPAVGNVVTGNVSAATGTIAALIVNPNGTLTAILSGITGAFTTSDTAATLSVSGAVIAVTAYAAATGFVETYATSLQPHPYKTNPITGLPLMMNADQIDLPTIFQAYLSEEFHTP